MILCTLAMTAMLSATTPDHRPTFTVGGPDADIPGRDGRAIQMAIEAAAAAGGGTVSVAAGDYLLADSLRLRAGVTVLGVRGETRLIRGPLVWSRLTIDADKAETQMTPQDVSVWRVGMGVCFRDPVKKQWSQVNEPMTITAIAEGTCHLHDHLVTDTLAENGGIAVNHFPMVLAQRADGAVLDGFDIDAAVEDPEGILDGLTCHGIYTWRSPGIRFTHLTVRNARYDGIVLSNASVGAVVEDTTVLDSRNFGIHPGSHSTDVLVQRCTIRGSGSDGIWICWGVRRGRFLDNLIEGNGGLKFRSGICTGHKDSDVLIAGNTIRGNHKHGIAFRAETEANGAHRTVVRDNLIENNGLRRDDQAGYRAQLPDGASPSAGIAVGPIHRDLVIRGNTIRETRSGEDALQSHAIVVAEGSSLAEQAGNTMSGHPAEAVVDHNLSTVR